MNILKMFSLYVILSLFFISDTDAQKELLIGSKASAIDVTDHFGNTFSWKEKLKEGPIVVVFYRGHWCQYCNLYMYSLSDSLSMITDLGGSLIAVTPESNEYIEQTIDKTHGGNFSVVYDVRHEIMDQYDVTWHVSKFVHFFYRLRGINLNKASDGTDRALPVPATYIIGQDGKIKAGYFNKDFTKRMPVSKIVKELKKL